MDKHIYHTDKGDITYWLERKQPRRPTLVFLPGLTADHRLFDAQTAYFAENSNVLTWDAPGHGESRPFDLGHSLPQQAAWLHGILEREGIERPVLVGQSMGGYVSQCYMDEYPGSAAGFVSIDSAPLKRGYVTGAEIWLLDNIGPFYRAYPWKRLRKDGAKGCAESEHGRALMYSFMDSYTKKEYCELAARGYAMLAAAYRAGRMYRIDCPALLICGEKDRAGSTKRYNRKWAEKEGLELAWISDAGHNSNTDRPELVNHIIEDFLRRYHL